MQHFFSLIFLDFPGKQTVYRSVEDKELAYILEDVYELSLRLFPGYYMYINKKNYIKKWIIRVWFVEIESFCAPEGSEIDRRVVQVWNLSHLRVRKAKEIAVAVPLQDRTFK